MAEEFSLTELARAVWHRKRLVVAIVALCVLAAGAVTGLMPKIYRAETSVFFPGAREAALPAAWGALGASPGLIASLAGVGQPGAGAAALCKAIAESYSVRDEICREFDLQPHFRAQGPQQAADRLRAATWVNITPEGLLVIRVDLTDPRLAAEVANAYSRIVERRYRESSVSRAADERRFLEDRLVTAQRELARAEGDLKTYQQRAEALLRPDEVPPILAKMADVRVEQARAEVELEAMHQRRDDAVRQLGLLAQDDDHPQGRTLYEVPWLRTSETISDNPDIAALRAQLVSLEVNLAAARHNLTPQHPEFQLLQTQVEETRQRLAAEARKTLTSETRTRDPVYAAALEEVVSLETAALGQEARARGLAQLVADMEQDAAGLPERLLRYSRLEREVRAREAVYATLTTQLEVAKLKELQDQPVFEMLDRAVVPQRHDRPRLAVNLLVALVMGAFAAIAAAAALGPRRA